MRFALAVLCLLLLAATPSPAPSASQQISEGGIEQNAKPNHEQQVSTQGGQPTVPPTCQQVAPTNTTTANHQWWNGYAAFGPSTWSTWTLALFAGLAARIALRTLREIRHQVQEADKAVRLDQRAWIIATGEMRIGFLLEPGEIPDGFPFPVCVFLKNTGRTPARNLKISTNCDAVIFTDPVPTIPELPSDEPRALGAIGPGVTHGHWMMSRSLYRNDPLTKDKVFAAWGLVTYEDIFGDPHATKFFLAKIGPGPEAPTDVSGPYNDCT